MRDAHAGEARAAEPGERPPMKMDAVREGAGRRGDARESRRGSRSRITRHQVREPHRHRSHAGARGSWALADGEPEKID